MQEKFKKLILFSLIVMSFFVFLNASESDYENKIKSILKEVFGIKKSIVSVKFIPRVSLTEEEKKAMLPGVPEIEQSKIVKELPPKIHINIILPVNVNISKEKIMRFLKENLSLFPEDIVNIKYMPFAENRVKGIYLKSVTAKDLVIYSFILIVLIFLFGPVRIFIKNFNEALQKAYSKVENEEDVKFIDVKPKAISYIEEKEIPFSFINEDNIKNLAFVLRKEEPEKISLVAGFLREGLLKKFLDFFPVDVQEEIILNLSKETQIPYKEVKELEEEIKEKIKLVFGGKDKVIRILEKLPPEKREKFLDFLSIEMPELALELKNILLSFDDLAKFSYKELKFIINYIKTPLLLKALKFARKEVREKIFTLLSARTVRYIKEEIDRELITKEESLRAQIKILHIVRDLMAKGLI